jgi:hypothetical protein
VTDCGVLQGNACSRRSAPQRCTSNTPTTVTECLCVPASTSPESGEWVCSTSGNQI